MTEPVVVGGTAQDYHTAPVYNPTDLDLCAPLAQEDEAVLIELGFRREGRYWEHVPTNVVVEFPEAVLDGEFDRTVIESFGETRVRIIGLDDLYLDRVRQVTLTESSADQSFKAAIAIAASRFEDIDWRYVRTVIDRTKARGGQLGEAMARVNRKVRRKARDAIS